MNSIRIQTKNIFDWVFLLRMLKRCVRILVLWYIGKRLGGNTNITNSSLLINIGFHLKKNLYIAYMCN